MFVHCCHCTSCQHENGTAFALNALWEADRVRLIAGETEAHLIPTESGKGQMLARCPACRAVLWSNYAGAGEAIRFVRVGTLDDPAACVPDVHIYVRSKLPWVVLPDGARAFEGYYSTRAEWPEESLARRAAAVGA
ncbi:GFA family protein [Sphingomonas sp.]|uniref:GFA family protein n=1 Tax=Sphingomonas sp. TaxID=28214 RepID=UPI0025E93852|nr:GFA family protein [Sphingomonas sp.]